MSSSLPPYEPQPSYLRSLMHDYHQQINAQTDATVADLQQRWIAARAAINADIARLQQQMETAIANGDSITYAWLADAQRLAALKASVEGNIAQFADATRQLVADGQLSALDLGTNAAQEALAATVPPGLSYTFGVPPAEVLHAQAGALSPTSPLTALFAQLGPDAAKSAQAALFTSVALGEGPRAAATRLFWNTNLPRQRAEVIARTEILRSWRGAQMENYRANSDVVSGWQWSADFSDRTCFPASTLIQTRRGMVPIEFVHVGDEALTHTGRYRPVLNVMVRDYSGEMVTLGIEDYQVTATPDHPFLAFPTAIPDMSNLYLDWVSAANLAVGQIVACHAEYGHFNYLAAIENMTVEAAHVKVYNLEVDVDHSYIANTFVVHNCGACIAMDGTIHTLDEDLDDHIMGRCSALPITRPWSDILAGTGADTSGLTETSIASWDSYLYGKGFASDWFEGLAPEVQNSILGPAKAEAYRAGDITLNDLAGVRRDAVWGDSIQEVSLKQLGLDAQDYLAAARANGTDSAVADAEALAHAAEGTPAAMAEGMAKDAGEAERVAGEAKTLAQPTLEEAQQSLAAAQAQVDDLRQQWQQALVDDARASIPEGADAAIAQLAQAQAAVDVAQGGRGAIIIARSYRDPFAAMDALDAKNEAMFGRVLSRDELAGLVGAPRGAYAEFQGIDLSGDGYIINLHGPSWDPVARTFDFDSEYHADRYLLSDGRGGYYMSNASFSVREDLAGQGIGAQIFSDEARTLSDLDVRYIETHAAGQGDGTLNPNENANGYYTWPRFGYVGHLDEVTREALQEAVANGDVPSAWGRYTTVQQLMRTPAGRDWWRMNGQEIDLKFDLRPNSLSMRTLDAYMREKGYE